MDFTLKHMLIWGGRVTATGMKTGSWRGGIGRTGLVVEKNNDALEWYTKQGPCLPAIPSFCFKQHFVRLAVSLSWFQSRYRQRVMAGRQCSFAFGFRPPPPTPQRKRREKIN